MSLNVAGLFAGVGGLELGLRNAGHRTSLLCEKWEPALAVLKEQFPDTRLHEDIRDLDSLSADTDMIAAGFPCQDLSQAGKTAGIEGARSGLVGEIFRILDKQNPSLVLLENVSFMLHLNQGRALDLIVSALETRGYRWAYRVVNSLSYLPQRRERVFLLASNSELDPAEVLFADEAEPDIPKTDLAARAHGFYWTEGIRGLGWAVDAIPTLKNGSTVGIPSPPAILFPDGRVATPDIRDAERLQGFTEDWTLPAANVGRTSLRWSLAGNAVSVPVAEWIGKRITSPGQYERSRDEKFNNGDRWPKAARSDGNMRFKVSINAFPAFALRPALVEFLNYSGKDLSIRATKGFLSRTERSSLNFPSGFQDRLKRHLMKMHAMSGLNNTASFAAE